MKITVVLATLLLGSLAASDLLAQGAFNWGNFYSGVTSARIYGPEPSNPQLRLTGNAANGLPVGNTVYTGVPLLGTGFTLAIYTGSSAAEAMSAVSHVGLNTTGFRTGGAAGLVFALDGVDPNHPVGAPNIAYQFRAWDNRGGTVTSWSQVMAAGAGGIAAGSSEVAIFTTPLGGGTLTPPSTTGIRSFNLTVVPEPSLIALGALGLGGLLLRRRK
jgi:hypothetical protein